MSDLAELSEKLVQAYNAKDFDALSAMIAPAVDFAHFNRDFVLNSRDELIGVLRGFAADCVPDRHFEAAEKVIVSGDTVIRQAWYVGTAAMDLAGFGQKGEAFRLKFASFMRFDEAGVLVEWKDFG